jgi:hypothetical protein
MSILKNPVNPVYTTLFFATRLPFRYTLALSLGLIFPEGGKLCLTFPRATHPSKSEPF